MDEPSDLLFTYGTLMQRFKNPFAVRLRELSVYLGKGTFSGQLYRVSWYPCAVYQKENSALVHGEIYQLLDATRLLKDLDEYEDVLEDESESLYLRKQIPIMLEGGTVLSCWTYVYNRSVEGLELIADGRF